MYDLAKLVIADLVIWRSKESLYPAVCSFRRPMLNTKADTKDEDFFDTIQMTPHKEIIFLLSGEIIVVANKISLT